jgi:NAD+ synthase (glutamine-hydrolysing)
MQQSLTILSAQINPHVGALAHNRDHIINIIKTQQKTHDVIVFPELALTGYPPEDLLFRDEFHDEITACLEQIRNMVQDCYVLIGHPLLEGDCCYNALSILHQGTTKNIYYKQKLPNYGVFDEARYFTPGPEKSCVFEVQGQKIGVCLCEDIWQEGPVGALIQQGISLLIACNASPFDDEKYPLREALLKTHAQQGILVLYVNQVAGQDELLFDGQSLAMDTTGTVCARSPAFEEDLCTIHIKQKHINGPITPLLEHDALIYKALVFGTREYVRKNQFPGVLLGLSGGIDSALTLCIAVDALGPENVQAVLMPSRYSASISYHDAMEQITLLGVQHTILSIEPAFEAILSTLESEFSDKDIDTTEENIQARIRGLLLMALSNKSGKMVLTTSNKSETAIGYSTLYGDMAGGFAVLKDVLKTQVYALAHYRNAQSKAIPARVITRAPSAELKPNQTDQDNLPDYAVLDAIIVAFMQHHATIEELIQQGFEKTIIKHVLKLIKRNEYKRHQAPPGIKISPTAFGRDWRYPITNGFDGLRGLQI